LAGRKRKNGPRSNGKLKPQPRYEKREDMQSVVREARERVYGVTRLQAEVMPQTTELAHLLATGEISQRQYDAGARYGDIVRAHDALLGIRGVPKAGDLDRGAAHDGDETAADRSRYRSAMAKYDRCRSALRELWQQDRMALSVVDAVCVNDWALPDMVPSLRVALNRLARVVDVQAEALDIPRELVHAK